MTFTLQTLGTALITAGLMASAQATAVSLSALIDFEELVTAPRSLSPSPDVSVGDLITTQYAHFGVEFTGPNVVNCSSRTMTPGCTATHAIGDPNPPAGRHFLMNKADATTGQYSGFSLKVLDGFSLSTLKLDIARNDAPFSVKLFDGNGAFISSAINEQTGSDFRWVSGIDLLGVAAAVRRIDFGGDAASSFAIDFLSFNYVANSTNVPEPAMLSMVVLALAGVGLSRRRRA